MICIKKLKHRLNGKGLIEFARSLVPFEFLRFDESAADLLDDLEIDAIKIASFEITVYRSLNILLQKAVLSFYRQAFLLCWKSKKL